MNASEGREMIMSLTTRLKPERHIKGQRVALLGFNPSGH